MATPKPSYYFTLFKKFELLGHLPEGSDHGAPGGEFGFDVNDPNSAFGSSHSGVLPGATSVNGPLMGMLNAKAMGRPGVMIGRTIRPAMPLFVSQSWTDFPVSTLRDIVDFLPTASIGGNVNDIRNSGKMITKEDLC